MFNKNKCLINEKLFNQLRYYNFCESAYFNVGFCKKYVKQYQHEACCNNLNSRYCLRNYFNRKKDFKFKKNFCVNYSNNEFFCGEFKFHAWVDIYQDEMFVVATNTLKKTLNSVNIFVSDYTPITHTKDYSSFFFINYSRLKLGYKIQRLQKGIVV